MRHLLIIGMASAAAVLLLTQFSQVEQGDDGDDVPYDEPSLLDQADGIFQDLTDMTNTDIAAKNTAAFLWMLRVSEGTAGPEGYRTIVGGSLFDSYTDHPRRLIWIASIGKNSSAAGAYQILRDTWDGVRGSLPDFSPASQDAAAIKLISRRGALADVRAGRFAVAVEKCKKEWASLPGAGYGQRENALAKLQTAYTGAGGYLA